MSYCNTDELKQYIGGFDNDNEDALLDDMIANATKIINSHTRRVFEATAYTTRYFTASLTCYGGAIDETDPLNLVLDRDLCAVNPTAGITNGDGVEVTSGQYTTKPKNDTPYYMVRLLPNSGIAWTYDDDPDDAIAISGKWAYSLTAPDDIKHATLRLAGWIYRQRDNLAELDRPVMSGQGAVLLPTRLPQDVVTMLSPYVRRLV
jgi:hypothetical protein